MLKNVAIILRLNTSVNLPSSQTFPVCVCVYIGVCVCLPSSLTACCLTVEGTARAVGFLRGRRQLLLVLFTSGAAGYWERQGVKCHWCVCVCVWCSWILEENRGQTEGSKFKGPPQITPYSIVHQINRGP